MKKLTILIALLLVCSFVGCKAAEMPKETQPQGTQAPTESIPPSVQEKITVKGRAYSVEEIRQGILRAFHTEFYYAPNDTPHLNRDIILNKTLNYDLVFVDDSLPHILLIVNNLEHPLSTEEKPLYCFGVAFSERGMEEKFYIFGTAGADTLAYMTELCEEVYLGSYSLCISEIEKPRHEQMSEEWKQRAKTVLQQYMDTNKFSSETEKNLESGRYHVYIKGFAQSDTDTSVIFEHENGTVYESHYHFVHDATGGPSPASIENISPDCLEKIKLNAAFEMVYEVE